MSPEGVTGSLLPERLPGSRGAVPLLEAPDRDARRMLPLRALRWAGTASRLAALHGVVLAAVLAGSVIALLHTTTVGVQQIATRQLRAELESYVQAAAARTSTTSLRDFSILYLRSHAVPGGNLVEVSLPGQWTVANAGGSNLTAQPLISSLVRIVPAHTVVRAETVRGRDVEILATPIRAGGRAAGVFVAAVDTTGLKPAADAAVRLAIGEAAIALVVGIASAYLLLRRLLRRVGRITDTAEKIGRDQLDDRLGDQGTKDEVARLATSFDSMLDRIQSAVLAQHELLSDVSHQLRTPLTVARGHLELLGRSSTSSHEEVQESVGIAIAELDRMGRLVERLLVLGRAREPVRRDMHDVDVGLFLGELFAAAQVLADRRWWLDPPPDAVVRFDETEVRGAVLNLIDNAVRATSPGDAIRVSACLADGRLRMTVEDSGPGIPEPDRRFVLDRFARPGSNGTGNGLGLAIVSAVCHAHGGSVEVGESNLGGASVTMTIAARTAGGSS